MNVANILSLYVNIDHRMDSVTYFNLKGRGKFMFVVLQNSWYNYIKNKPRQSSPGSMQQMCDLYGFSQNHPHKIF